MDFPGIRRAFRVERGRPDVEAEVNEEVEFHLARRAEELVAQGVPPHQAREEALRAFGDVDGFRRELTRLGEARAARRRRTDWFAGLAGDARLAYRALRREPAFAAMALLTLSIGIGAATAVFSVVSGVLLRPLPYPEPERLVRVQELGAKGQPADWAGANFYDVRERTRSLERLAFYRGDEATVLGADEATRARAYAVSGDFFAVFGVPAARGRTFAADEGRAGGPPTVVVSHGLWQRALGGDPQFGERLLRVDGEALRVVGVMPPGFAYPAGAELWRAYHDDTPARNAHNWEAVGRVARGRTVDDARAELGAIVRDLKARHGDEVDATGVYVRGLHAELAGESRGALLLLQGAVAFVLLLTCVNLANANLARGEARQREMAVRAALGAGGARLARLLLVENLLLAAGGGVLGVALAYWLTRAASAAGRASLPAFADVRVDPAVVAFSLGTAALAGLAVGVLPAWHAARTDLRGAMGEGGRSTSGRAQRRARAALVGAQVALAVALLVGGGLLVRSLRTLLAVSPGFDAERVLTADVSLPRDAYPDTTRIGAFYARLLPKLEAIPGVSAAAVVNVAPLGSWNPSSSFAVDGGADFARSANYRVVSEGYFRAMGIPLRQGRALVEQDRAGAVHAVVVNETAVRRYWPNESPVGHRVRFPGMDLHPDEWLTVVGVVGDVRHERLDAPAAPEMYVSLRQRPERLASGTLVLRGAASPEFLATALRGVLRAEDPNVPVAISSMRAALDRSVAPRRFTTAVLAAFGALGLMLAAVGIYGVLSYSVAQRQRELSMRMVLGGRAADIRRMVVRDAARAVLPGMAAGAVAAVVLTRSLQGLVYGVSATDPLTFAAVLALLLAVAALASYLPARRATRVDPMLAMRGE